jgi:hypothetical protein
VESLALVFSSGWASGINAYLVVLVLGTADRVGGYSDIPDVLGRWDILAIAGFMYAMEFVADKIPYVDSSWDAVSTLIRPTAGAAIGALLAGNVPEDTSLDQIVLASVGGGTALLSHLTKSGIRLAVNTSPEPVTNIGISLVEDVAVLGVVAFAIGHPRAAAAIAAVLLAVGLVILCFVARLVRRGWRRWKGRRTPAGTVP